MKIKYTKNKDKKIRQINFYQKENNKKNDNKNEKFLNFEIPKDLNRRKFILLVRGVVKRIKSHKLEDVSFDYAQIKKIEIENLSDSERAKIFVENLFIAEYKFDKFFSEKKGRIESVLVFGDFTQEEKKAFRQAEIVSDGVNFTRDLANTPGNFMTPTILANETKKKFKGLKNVKVKILEDKDTQKLNMGLYNSVGMGSVEKSKFIIIEYKNGPKNQKPFVLVGKGVTFDNGGNNLKPDGGKSMQMDMTGGATVIGAAYSIAKLGVKKNFIVLVPAVENLLSGSATKTGDIIKSMSGRTVKINNTDAEGRLVLADAITYAKRYKPNYIIDVATLTGAALVALGQRASAVMTNNQEMENEIREVGERVGDYFWPLPLWDEYLENMKSKFADISNRSNVSYGGAITAGMFLQEFVKDIGNPKWAHLDIAPRMESILADVLEPGATGEPVRMLVEFVKKK